MAAVSGQTHSKANSWQSWHERAAAYQQLLTSWPLFTQLADRLIDLLPGPFQGSLIDLAAGTGLVTERVLRRYPSSHIHLVEPAHAMLTLAQQYFGTGVATYVQSSAETVGQRALKADAALCNAAFHLLDENAVLASMNRCLKPGGVFICNLWWHSWQATAGPDYTSAWKPLIEEALTVLDEVHGSWPAPSSTRVRTESVLHAAARSHQFSLEQIVTDTDEVTNRFFIDFAAMSPTFLGHLPTERRTAVIFYAQERAVTPVQLQTTRLVFRRAPDAG